MTELPPFGIGLHITVGHIAQMTYALKVEILPNDLVLFFILVIQPAYTTQDHSNLITILQFSVIGDVLMNIDINHIGRHQLWQQFPCDPELGWRQLLIYIRLNTLEFKI